MDTNLKILDQNYWNSRYQSQETGWDLGTVSPPLKEYIDQLVDKNLRILIVGCGNAYEAEYLLESGFQHITLLDIAPTLVGKLKEKYASVPQIKVIQGDFFEFSGAFDLVFEQTFFCAIDPIKRQDYVHKMHELIVPNGKLVGVMFNTKFEFDGPPFGGLIDEYLHYFNPYFEIKKIENCYNSAKPRQNNEVFINFIRK